VNKMELLRTGGGLRSQAYYYVKKTRGGPEMSGLGGWVTLQRGNQWVLEGGLVR